MVSTALLALDKWKPATISLENGLGTFWDRAARSTTALAPKGQMDTHYILGLIASLYACQATVYKVVFYRRRY